ncbi:hypothetical protein BDW69DRAFT_202648 [Aspergillus filifer]
MPPHPITCTTPYTLSSLLDALDGLAARYLNQSTSFGAVLDMITDWCSATCLLVFLASAFPKYALVFQGLISLNYSSHYIHIHKDVDDGWNWALRVYYQRKNVLFTVCALNELCFVALYLLFFSSDPTSNSTPVIEGWSAAAMESIRVNKIRSFWPQILFYSSAQFMFFKQYVTILQIIQASKRIAQSDLDARRRERENTRRRRM